MIPESEWKFFEATEQRLKHLARHQAEIRIARWTGAELPWDPGEVASRRAAALQDLDYPERLETALGMDPAPEQARHLALHRRWALQAIFETHPDLFPLLEDLEERWVRFRPEVANRPATWAELAEMIRESPDRDLREAAWKAVFPLADSIRGDMAELVRRRELLSRSLLAAGFPVVAFHFGEMDRAEGIGLLDMFERTTRKAYEAAKTEVARALGIHEVEPWDLVHGFDRGGALPAAVLGDPLAAAREQALRWGFPEDRLPTGMEVSGLPVESWAIWVEAPGDARFLYRPGTGWHHARAVFHAFGAALHGRSVTSHRHFLEQDAPAAVEASGRLFEGVLDDPDWLRERTGASANAIDAHLRVQRSVRILELRRHAAVAAFENLVYAASDLDPQRLYGDVMEQMLRDTRRPESVWTAHPDLLLRPAASGAAMVGALLAAQIRRRSAPLPAASRDAETGAWIRRELMEPGAARSLEEKIAGACGGLLGLDALAAELAVSFEGPRLEESEEVSDAAVAEYFEGIDLEDETT